MLTLLNQKIFTGGPKMKRLALAGAVLLPVALTGFQVDAQDTIKIGVIAAYSGQFADTAQQMDNGIRLYMKQHGDTVAGRKIEIIRRDSGGPNPDVSKRLAQELIVRDKVDILAGFTTSPEALAAADVSAASQKFMVSMNGTASTLTTKSPYVVRTSFTLPQVAQALGAWAATKGRIKKAYTMVTDFGPGIDGEQYFQRGFKQAGGEIIGSVRTPLANPDFAPFVQRVKDANPESIFVFVPGGSQPAALGKAFAERGIDPNKIKIMSSGEAVDETAIKGLGELAIGRLSAQHYDYNHHSPKNEAFVKAYNAEFKRNPDFFSVGGYDGMHLIYEALKKTGGKADGDSLVQAAKGMQWESPRGPMLIDPETRDVVQTVYIRRVEKVDGKIANVDIDKVENVKDPVKANQ
jgi:branched-chain amino acid transport system substrate-binding protein